MFPENSVFKVLASAIRHITFFHYLNACSVCHDLTVEICMYRPKSVKFWRYHPFIGECLVARPSPPLPLPKQSSRERRNRAFSLTWQTAMQIWEQENFLRKVHQHGRRSFILEQYGCRDITCSVWCIVLYLQHIPFSWIYSYFLWTADSWRDETPSVFAIQLCHLNTLVGVVSPVNEVTLPLHC